MFLNFACDQRPDKHLLRSRSMFSLPLSRNTVKSFFDDLMSPVVGETVHGACGVPIADNSSSRTVSCGTAVIRTTLNLQTPLPWFRFLVSDRSLWRHSFSGEVHVELRSEMRIQVLTTNVQFVCLCGWSPEFKLSALKPRRSGENPPS